MSGVNRAIKAENAHSNHTGASALAAFAPEKIRAETGRSLHSESVDKKKVAGDTDDYLGKNGKDATPKK